MLLFQVRRLWEHGIALCVNTDDPGIMGINLNQEMALWSALGFSDPELRAMTVMALEHCFLPVAEKEALWGRYFAATHSSLDGATVAVELTLAEALVAANELHALAVKGGGGGGGVGGGDGGDVSDKGLTEVDIKKADDD